MKMLRITTLLAFSLSMFHCTGELPLSDLINNTISLKVMGTYESNNPYDFGFTGDTAANLWKDDVITGAAINGSLFTLSGAPPDIVSYANALKPSDIKYYIDLAEIRLASGQGKSSSQSISDYWMQFAIERQLLCSDYNTADPGLTLSTCAAASGIERLAAFFNGGFTYPAVDVPSGNFNHLGIYFRRFVTSPGARFNENGSYYNGSTEAPKAVTAAFDNRTIYGFDMEAFLQNSYGATNTEPLMFPLQRKDLSLSIGGDYTPYVMEVRIFIKNLMMVHVLQGTAQDGSNASFIYTGPSDWNVDHAFKDGINAARQGGALIMTARTYQPSNVGSIQFSNGVATTTNISYYVAIPSGQTFDSATTLPYAATAAATSGTITNLPPGTYNIYRTCDKTRCSTASTAGSCDNAAGTDGFPESSLLCTSVIVTQGTATPLNLTGLCAPFAGCT